MPKQQTPAKTTNAALGLSEQLEAMLKQNEAVVARELDEVFANEESEEIVEFPLESEAFELDSDEAFDPAKAIERTIDANIADSLRAVKQKRPRAEKVKQNITIDAVRADINDILALGEYRKAVHWRLAELGLNLAQISAITSAGITNISRDLWAFKAGKCPLPTEVNYKRKPKDQQQ